MRWGRRPLAGSGSSARDEPDALQDDRLAMNNSINQSLSFAYPASDKSKGPESLRVVRCLPTRGT